MKSFAFAITLGAVSAVSTVDFEYMNYIARFNKQSNDLEEFNSRREAFEEADAFIQSHNASTSNYTVGHNKFSDWFPHEVKVLMGYREGPDYVSKEPTLLDASMNADSVDWVTAGAVTPVMDQGNCGSCWAFSTTGSLEGAHWVATGDLLDFSEQQLVDCAYETYGNEGCNGGLQQYAYAYYEAGFNAEAESVYAYISGM